ncbi:MAG: hypothetical protein H9535_10850 [Ignavibacteria bacterium]|nr:hypothetical protein [Ignavibacteria bacterium]
MSYCFEDSCVCNCNSILPDFDSNIKKETNFNLSLHHLCHSNIGWFSDKSICDDHFLADWIVNKTLGVYFLWHKDDYCPTHELFHMKCLYVGKGLVLRRIINHFLVKDFSAEMLVYFTYLEMPNRQAKYVEQLILDIYNIPHNHSEKTGTEKLCMYFTQTEVDFGGD